MSSKKGRAKTKKLFIISPIGKPKSKVQTYSNKVRRHIIDPVAAEKGYVTKRADNISKPGRITKQIVGHLLNDDLVVADLTHQNPNVFYELAVRHAVGKPVILLATFGEKTPFDVAAQRVIFYDLDPDNIATAKEELKRQISEVESDTFIVDSPIETSVTLKRPEKAGNGEQQEIIAILRNQSIQLRRLLDILGVSGKRESYAPDHKQRLHRALYEAALAKYQLKPDLYEIEHGNWNSFDPDTDDVYVHSSLEAFHKIVEEVRLKRTSSKMKTERILHDDERMHLWIITSADMAGNRIIDGWTPRD